MPLWAQTRPPTARTTRAIRPPPEGDDASMQAVRLAVCVNPALLVAHGESARARSWVRERVQAFLAPLVAPVDATQLPLTVAQQGSVYEAATALPHAQAAAALRASGKVLGVTCRPWLRGEESPVPSRMLWLTLPAASRAPLPELWKRLTEQPQLGTFGGLMEGDSAGRVGVRLFGTGPIASGIRELVGEALDAAIPPPHIIVRVGGYPIGFGLAFGSYQAIRGEIPKVFGGEAGNVRVVSCTHLTATGQERPKFDVTLEGVDEAGENSGPRGLPTPPQDMGGPRADTGTPYVPRGRRNGPGPTPPPPPHRPRGKLGGLGTVVRTRPWMGWLGRPLHAPMWPNQGGTTCCRVQPDPPYGLGQGGTTCCCWVQPDPPCNLGQGGTTCCRLQPGPPPPPCGLGQGGTTCCRVQPDPPCGLGQGGTACCCWVQPDPPCYLGQGGTTCCRLQPGPPPPPLWHGLGRDNLLQGTA